MKSEKENLVRVAGNSFCGKEPSARELQLQISELKKQKENICFTLAEALKKNSLLKTQLDVPSSLKLVIGLGKGRAGAPVLAEP